MGEELIAHLSGWMMPNAIVEIVRICDGADVAVGAVVVLICDIIVVVAVDNAADAVAVVPVAVEKSLATDLRRLVGAVRTFGNSVAKDI